MSGKLMALLGCNTIADLGPQYLYFADPQLRHPTLARRTLRAVETKAAAEA